MRSCGSTGTVQIRAHDDSVVSVEKPKFVLGGSCSGISNGLNRIAQRKGVEVVCRAERRSVADVNHRLPQSNVRENETPMEDVEETKGNMIGKSAVIALMSAALVLGSFASPDDALAARSGGRVGGSSGFSSRRSMPRAAPGPSVRNYNYYSAPPLVSPYGFGMPFFGGGIVAPFPLFGLGSIFNIMILLFMINVAVNVISSFTNAKRGDKEDRWDDDDEW